MAHPPDRYAGGTMQVEVVPWPSLARVLAIEYTGRYNFGRRMRFAWVMARSRALHWRIERAASLCPWVVPALTRYPILLTPLTSGFLCARHHLQQRFHNFAHDLTFTSTRIHRQLPKFFEGGSASTLWHDEASGCKVILSLNVAYPREGLWQLSLRTHGHPQLFCIRFSVLPGPIVFVGAVQGACSDAAAFVPDVIRETTRDLHGLRPHFLLFEVLRSLAAAWQIDEIHGIASEHQVKCRSRKRKSAALFSYDRYFQELGAEQTLEGNWRMPASIQERRLAEVPSRKRAMYRRRNDLLAQLRMTVSNAMRGRPRSDSWTPLSGVLV